MGLCELAIVVGPGATIDSDTRSQIQALGFSVRSLETFRVVHIRARSDDPAHLAERLSEQLLIDPVGQWWCHRGELRNDGLIVETGLRPGVTDREAAELVRIAAELGLDLEAASIGRRHVIDVHRADGSALDAGRDGAAIELLARRVLHNEVIERWGVGELAPAFAATEAEALGTLSIPLARLESDGLAALNRSRRLGLDVEELRVIQSHFAEQGRAPTDAELETLAQTWSEHCAHKTFRARITFEPDGEVVDGLLKSYLRAATDRLDAPWVRSAFVDNAGIVEFEPGWDIALKAETHNHPSALEPFGGANTGVGGVVRDILGVSAKPVALTDILCFGPEDLPLDRLPDGVLHPHRVRNGVIAGVGDYGNKIGVPNLAGAIVHDPSYTTTPLVFAGCFGLLPTGSNPTMAQPGDSIVVLGGAVGRDGVGGATFSSQTMGVETAEIAGSSVQIGDPIVEKGLIDVVLEARDAGLYNAITDCGAGGLSSAIGEMAHTLGADVDLALVPRKYPGLAPWEVWLSEAQERMVLAVPDPEPLLELAGRWSVGAAVIGTFTGRGRLVVRDSAGGDPDQPVIDLDCGFLHDGRPQRQMIAERVEVGHRSANRTNDPIDPAATLLRLLAHPSIRSNESVLRTYDHEVLGGTYVRPYGGPQGDGPGDGTVLIPPGTSGTRGMALGIGVNAAMGRLDPGAMAWNVIDEAIRNVVVAGADPDQLSLLDNFAWGNPTDPATLGGLVAACAACHDASLHHGAPFVSGKDSLYNVFVHPDGTPDPVAPTLVITAVGLVKDLTVVPITGVVEAGDDVWLVGPPWGELGGSHLDLVLGEDHGGLVPQHDPDALGRHREVASAIAAGLVRSAHDLSEGGLAVAAAEWSFAGRLGLELDVSGATEVLFGEAPGRYLLEVRPDEADRVGAFLPSGIRIGSVTDSGRLRIGPIDLDLDDVGRAYTQRTSAHRTSADRTSADRTSADGPAPAGGGDE
ncbi:MAG: phosphoribosylformylglycinamidine synthase subunit PurL [Actinomycetota bacterium]|nr:phosphoribosylformylglycinamidine synthase subunit PurL [Actinomycetota bacterium]